MTAKRKTSRDYRRELKDLHAQERALRLRIIKHTEELCKKYPGVRIGEFTVNDYLRLGENPGEGMTVTEAIDVMKAIEENLENRHPHKQGVIKFPDCESINL